MAWGIVIGWVLVFGTICALIGPRKGRTPGESFVFGAVFGIFAVVGMALMRDDPLPPPAPRSIPDTAPTRVKVYRPGEEARFRHDQGEAAENGWYPVARDFAPDGSLRVTYRKVGRSEWAA